MSRPTTAHIDLNALVHNLQQVKNQVKHAKIMAVVKANAYGHGLEIAKTLTAADAFGVSCLEEALILRKHGIKQKIVLLEGFFEASELKLIEEHDLDITLHNELQLTILEQIKSKHVFKLWLKIDTGMHRLGFQPQQTHAILERLEKLSWIQKPIKLMTHFANADSIDNHLVTEQLQSFNTLCGSIPGEKCIANSGAILAYHDSHADWVRPGIMLYGISPFAEKCGQDYQLKPVMTLRSELIAVTQHKKGESVGYSGTYICPEDMPIGVVAIGYGDGYPRHAENGTPVLVNGQHAKLAGRVSMDMITVDLRQQANAKIGDPVILWGKGLPAETVAKHANTIAYQLTTGITHRVRFCLDAIDKA